MDSTPGESSPLISGRQHSEVNHQGRRCHALQSPSTIVMLLLLLNSCGEQIMETPQTRIYESIICYRYYEATDTSKINVGRDLLGPGAIGGVDEVFCKAPAVQDELATLNGVTQFLDGLPTLILALVFGWAADKFGRWPFVFINLIQSTLRAIWIQLVTWRWQSFDLRAVWFTSALNLLGGGPQVVSALFYVVITDITQEDDRGAMFLRMGAASLSATCFMPPLAAWLMQSTPWIPFLLGTTFMGFSVLLWLFVPETLHDNKPKPRDYARPSSPTPSHVASSNTAQPTDPWISRLISAISFLTTDWRVPALIVPFTTHILIATTGRLLLQYISKRSGLTLAGSTLLVTIRNAITVVLLFLIFPYISTTVARIYRLDEQKKDLYLARTSQIFVAAGWLGVAFSSNIPTIGISLAIVSLGSGSLLLTRSFLVSLVPAHQIAKVNSIISVVDTLGTMFGAPLLATLFKQGLALGKMWIGLPFLFIGILSTIFVALLFAVRSRQSGFDGATTEDEDQ